MFIVLLLQVAMGAIILALALWILSDTSPFQDYGTGGAWGRCIGLVAAVNVLAVGGLLIGGPMLGLLLSVAILVVWFLGIMMLFEKTFGQAFFLTLSMWVIGLLLEKGLSIMLT